ncbi:MAG: hypothetical protein M1816_008189 [Peltula sp. TS41687]|nr:MAG: hypothetical protein M1816_008189 [Peltula sp. TS41687]
MALPETKRRKLSPQESGNSSILSDSGIESPTKTEDAVDENDNQSEEHTNQTPPSSTGPTRKQPKTIIGQAISKGVHKSGLFALQVEELLADVRLDRDIRRVRVDALLRALKWIIEHIPEQEELPVKEAEKRLRKSNNIAIPFPEPRPSEDVKYKLAYLRPTSINVVGSYAFGTAIEDHGSISIDMAVNMPSSLFQGKDYKKYRYFHKRAYYIASIAAGIAGIAGIGDSDKRKLKCDLKTSYEALNGNDLQPILRLEPYNDKDQDPLSDLQCVIRVMPVVSHDTFAASRFLPNKNCLGLPPAASNGAHQKLTSTPFYNSSLRSDCLVDSYLMLLYSAAAHCEAFKDTCILGRLWLRQRGFGGSIDKGGFGHFEWAVLMALLLHEVISPGYNSCQMFKAMLQFLSLRDLSTHALLVRSGNVQISKGHSPGVFYGEGDHNLLFKMTQWSYKLLRLEASTSLKMLNDSRSDYFEAAFITKVDRPLEKFDLIARIPVSSVPVTSADHESESMRFCRKISSILSKGLGDRVQIIYPFAQRTVAWSTKAASPAVQNPSIEVRILLDPVNAGRIVDHGPSAEYKAEAAAFRKFWGPKAELRRFKDGSILESVVWTGDKSNRPIAQQIIIYLLERHVESGIVKSIDFVGDIFRDMLPEGAAFGSQALTPFQPLMTVYDELENSIRRLEGLPLQIRHIAAASSSLRYSSVQVPTKDHLPTPADVVILFEGSGRWPDDLIAVQRTKIAILLKMGELLTEAKEGIVTRVGLENEKYRILNSSFLEVIYKNVAFRLRIQNEREETLIDRRLKDKNLDPRSRDEAALALAIYKRTFIQAPFHTQAVRTLCTRFPLLSPTIILVQKFFNSHLLFPHFSEEFIELLVVRTFVQPYPWQAPSSVMTGFLRTLFFLSRWDWRVEPLIVDINGELERKDIEMINIRFEAWKKIDPGMTRMVLFVASKLDPDGITWTQKGPSRVVAARMTTLARSAYSVIKEAELTLDPAVLFTSSTTDYDFLLHIHPRFTAVGQKPQPSQAAGKYKNLSDQFLLQQNPNPTDLELTGYAPLALFIEELQTIYSSTLLLFYNPEEADVIAGIWNPNTGPRHWKVNLTYSTRPLIFSEGRADGHHERAGDGEESRSEIDINKPAILNEIARLGGDMISKVEVLRGDILGLSGE